MNALFFSLSLVSGGAELPLLELTADDTVVTESARVRIPEGLVIEDVAGDGVLQIRTDGVRLLFEEGSVLRGAAEGVAPDQLTGTGVRIEGCNGVRLEGLRVSGYHAGVHASGTEELFLSDLDVSDNFAQRLRSTPRRADDEADWLACHDNDANEWLGRYGAGIYVEDSEGLVVRRSRARRTQNGLLLDRVSGAEVYDNDFSFLSGWGLGLWRSSDNVVARNAFDFCIRGYSHGVYNRGQDSAGILVFEQCSRNVFAYNSATHGGDGVFGFAGSEALGERRPLPPGFDATRRGNNDNVFLGNDFSFAAAHGLEMTFSFGNVVEANLFEGNAICGIWGGYSHQTLLRGNVFSRNGDAGYGRERGGVNIEHGVENWVLGNRFEENACGVHLWWDEDAHLAGTPWARANGVGCEGNVVAGNRFERDEVALELRACEPVVVRDNAMEGVGSERVGQEGATVPGAVPELPAALGELDVPGETRPVGARRGLGGREAIRMGVWGPWDHASEFIAPPDPLEVEWEVACFALETDPRGDAAGFAAAAARAMPEPRRDLALVFAAGGPRDLGLEVGDEVGREHFGTVARAEVVLPPGTMRLETTSDDGLRVWIDEELVIDDWTQHAPRAAAVELTLEEARRVRLRVEHFELEGYAVLAVELVPAH